jgi:hypothetical protein
MYKPDQKYEYHTGAIRHNIDNYLNFKVKLFHLIKLGWIKFDRSQNASNMNTKPLPNHVATRKEDVNMISKGFRYEKKRTTLKMTIRSLFYMLS